VIALPHAQGRIPSEFVEEATMDITVSLSDTELIALSRLANMLGRDLDFAAYVAVREFLIGAELLGTMLAIDEETETMGIA